MKSLFKSLFILSLLLLFPGFTIAQQASAEFISSIEPAKLKSGEQAVDGIRHVFFNEQKLYITNTWSGLQIVDVSNVNNPREIGDYTTENRSHNCFVENNYAYLSSELYGVSVLDISDPKSIREVCRIRSEGDVQWVVAGFPYVYVAEGEQGVGIYDISNLNNPRLISRFDTPDWAWGLFLVDQKLYVGDKNGGLIILDVASANAPKRLGQFADMKYARSVQIENDIAYIANGADGLWIFDVRNPAFPELMSKVNVDGYVYNAYKSGNSAFLANETRRRMDIINVTNPKNPVKEGEYDAQSKVYSTWKNDVFVFIAADDKTVIVRHNHPPVLTEIADITTNENELLTISAEAYDPDGDAIYYDLENLPDGAVFDSLSGILTWTPTYDQSGIYPGVKLTVFEKTDSKLSSSSTFDINVTHINRQPSIPDVADTTINENQILLFTIKEGSDPDVEDKGRLNYYAENMPMGATFDSETRTFKWQPAFDQSGIYTIDFVVQDPPGLLMRDGATITVNHVDRKPVLAEVNDAVIDENSPLTISLSGSDPDQEDQGALSYRVENLPEGASFDPVNGQLTWTPTYDQSGVKKNVLFIFTAGNLSDSAMIDITVNHVNRPPVLNPIVDQTVNENDTLTFSISGTDPDSEDEGLLTYSAENLPEGAAFNSQTQTFTWVPTFEQSGEFSNTTFTVRDSAGLTDSKGVLIRVNHVNRSPLLAAGGDKTVDENTLLTFTLEGSDPDAEDQNKLVYSADNLPQGAELKENVFSWTPSYNQSGSYPIKFSFTDGQVTVSEDVTISVNHVNRNPALENINTQTVNENELLQFTVNGSDPDKEDEGRFKISASGLPEGANFDTSSNTFSWTPTFEQSGTYNVNFVNTDPAGLTAEITVPIEVNHINRTPIFEPIVAQTVDENSPLTVTLTPAQDPDKEDEGKLQYEALNLPDGATFDPTTLTFNWTPTFEQSGEYTVTFRAKDSEFEVDQAMIITVNHVNREPQIGAITAQTADEASLYSLKINATDPDEEDKGKLTVDVSNLPQGASFDASSATISWTPGYEQSGNYDGINITVTDPAGLSAQTTFTITVNHVNRAPEIQVPGSQTGTENEPLSFSVSASDPDSEDDGKLQMRANNLPSGASFDAGTGSFSWTPGFDQAGNYTLSFTVSDGQAEASADVEVSIANVNREPSVEGPASGSVEAGSTLNLSFTGTDPDNENLSYSLEGAPSGMTIGSGGNVSWTPGDEQTGTFSFSVFVKDSESQASTDVSVTVTPRPQLEPAPADTSGQ